MLPGIVAELVIVLVNTAVLHRVHQDRLAIYLFVVPLFPLTVTGKDNFRHGAVRFWIVGVGVAKQCPVHQLSEGDDEGVGAV